MSWLRALALISATASIVTLCAPLRSFLYFNMLGYVSGLLIAIATLVLYPAVPDMATTAIPFKNVRPADTLAVLLGWLGWDLLRRYLALSWLRIFSNLRDLLLIKSHNSVLRRSSELLLVMRNSNHGLSIKERGSQARIAADAIVLLIVSCFASGLLDCFLSYSAEPAALTRGLILLISGALLSEAFNECLPAALVETRFASPLCFGGILTITLLSSW